MVDQGKEADLRARNPRLATASEYATHAQDINTEDSGRPPARSASRGGLSDQTRTRLAVQLRTMYDAVIQQPVPDRFADLIAKLDSGDRERS